MFKGLYPAIVIVLAYHQVTVWDFSHISLDGADRPSVESTTGDMQFMSQHTSNAEP